MDNPAIWSGKDTFNLSGTLTEQNGNDLTIARSGGLPPVQLESHSRTQVTVNGKSLSSGQLDQLPINSQVKAKFQLNGDEIIATELQVTGGGAK
ncbi:hypothetical protein [Corallococcus sp. 4LFB]|uniref:hypothetical protein n=1 Tax=Corallococcus sp. 4LFB TaxID=3383249 RepID=UPI0039755881